MDQKKDPKKSETAGSEDEPDTSGGENEPLNAKPPPVKDYSGDEKTLTSEEEQVLKRLRKLRSGYSSPGDKEEEKADMHVPATPVDELSNEDPPDGDDDDDDDNDERDGVTTTSFITHPEQVEEKPEPTGHRIFQPRGAAPIASIEDETAMADFTRRKDEVDNGAPPPPPGEVMELRDIQLHDMERAGPPEEEVEAFECTRLGWFNCVGTLLYRVYSQLCTSNSSLSRTKKILAITAIVIFAYLIIFIGIFSASFEYVNYYQIALKQSRLTGVVDRDTVIYPGCYVLGPDADLIYFDSTAQTISSKVSVFTSDKLVVDVDISLHYFLRPEEVGKLHSKFGQNYHEVFESLVFNAIMNEGTKHSLEVFRLSRAQLEKDLFQKVQERLGGTCCPRCCPDNCDVTTVCSGCLPKGSCDQAYHVDIDYFQLGRVTIPTDVFERFLKQTILLIESEREVFYQQHAVEVKRTKREADLYINEAAEIQANATAFAKTVQLIAEAEKEAEVQLSYIRAFKNLYQRLNMTVEDHKLSLMMIRAYEDIKDNLYSYGFDKQTLGGS